jgi:hypothetical protein
MGKLVLHLPDGTVQDIVLGKEHITIGRRSDNDVCLPYPAVSSEHARVVTILNDSFLEDLGSTNGTLVNGQRVLKHLLCDHDQIDIGRQRLVYYVSETTRAEPLPPDVLLRDLEGLRDQVQRARSRRGDSARRSRLPEPVEDDELLADLEQNAAPAGAERALGTSAAEVAARGPASLPRAAERRRDAQSIRAHAPDDVTDAIAADEPTVERRRVDGVPKVAVVPPLTAALGGAVVGRSERSDAFAPGSRTSARAPRAKAGVGVAVKAAAGPEAAAFSSATLVAPAAPLARGAAVLWVRVKSGPSEGREMPVSGDEFWLGRVGTQVAKLMLRDGAWCVLPVEGSEPLLLNGSPVPASGAFVAPGDRFTVAGAEIEVARR